MHLSSEDKRGPVEPPLPGYMGFVPRIGPTEIGLGQRYHTRTQYGLDAFARDQSRHNDYLGSSTQPLTRSYTVSGDRYVSCKVLMTYCKHKM